MPFARLLLLPLLVTGIAACTPTTTPVEAAKSTVFQFGQARTLAEGKASFARVSKRFLPEARKACRRVQRANAASKCTFRLIIRAEQGNTPDARYTRNASGRPVIMFNGAMLKFLRDDNEMAMVLAHEMAHQIANHIERGQRQVIQSAASGAAAAKKAGKDPRKAAVKAAENTLISYSRQFEL